MTLGELVGLLYAVLLANAVRVGYGAIVNPTQPDTHAYHGHGLDHPCVLCGKFADDAVHEEQDND